MPLTAVIPRVAGLTMPLSPLSKHWDSNSGSVVHGPSNREPGSDTSAPPLSQPFVSPK